MATLRIVFRNGEQVGAKLKLNAKRHSDQVIAAFRQAAQEVAIEIETLGRADIKSAGKFGSRWTDGFKATITEGGGRRLIRVTEAVPYWTVFQDGKVIHGKPLLWIPLSFAEDAQGIRARDYPGQLFRVDRKGKSPLLLTPPGTPKYFGVPFVTIPKKFHLVEIVQQVARTLKDKYRAIRKGQR